MEKSEVVKNALVMVLNEPSGNPRTYRVTHLLNELGFQVDILSYRRKGELPVRKEYLLQFADTSVKKILRKTRNSILQLGALIVRSNNFSDYLNSIKYGYRSFLSDQGLSSYDLIVVEDLQLLPLAFAIKADAKILFDAREYYPKQRENSIFFRLFEQVERIRLCSQYLKLCDKVITVSPGLASEYLKVFDVTADIIRSTPHFREMRPTSTAKHTVRMVHHGLARENRKLSNMIDIVKLLDNRYTLDFYLEGSKRHIDYLKKYAEDEIRVTFHDPVPLQKIVPMLNTYDIGIFFSEPTTFNLRYSLPNKLFEYIQGRLAVAISPSPDMAALVREYNCGVVCDEFTVKSMADALNKLTAENIDNYKRNSDTAAQHLCYEKEMLKYAEIIRDIVQ